MGRTSLYRHFDKSGQLLYVGISCSFVARLGQHKGRSHWYWSIARVDVMHYPDRATAERAEGRAIRTENPLHNKAVPPPRKVRTAPRHLVLPSFGPARRHVFGYARGRGQGLNSMRADLGASGVPSSMMFVDDTEVSPTDRPSFVKMLKFAQHRGGLIFASNGSDFDADARSALADRGIELRLAMVAAEQNAANVRKSRARKV